LVDASCIGIIAALQHFRRPDVSVDGEDVTIHQLEQRVPVPLSMLHHPLCLTLSFFEGGRIILVDATLQERQLSDGEMVVTANQQGEVCQIAKLGGVPVDPVILLGCIEMAIQGIKELNRTISRSIEQDERQRGLQNKISELTAENDR